MQQSIDVRNLMYPTRLNKRELGDNIEPPT